MPLEERVGSSPQELAIGAVVEPNNKWAGFSWIPTDPVVNILATDRALGWDWWSKERSGPPAPATSPLWPQATQPC